LTVDDFTLLDDGTLDTVVLLPTGEEWRYSDTSYYRNDDGMLRFEEWINDEVIPDLEADPDAWIEE
jgi:hypothetical protein